MVHVKFIKKENQYQLIIGHYKSTCTTQVSHEFVEETKKNFRYELIYNDDDIQLVKLFVD